MAGFIEAEVIQSLGVSVCWFFLLALTLFYFGSPHLLGCLCVWAYPHACVGVCLCAYLHVCIQEFKVFLTFNVKIILISSDESPEQQFPEHCPFVYLFVCVLLGHSLFVCVCLVVSPYLSFEIEDLIPTEVSRNDPLLFNLWNYDKWNFSSVHYNFT